MRNIFSLALGVGLWLTGAGVAVADDSRSGTARARLGTGLFERSDTDRDGRVTAAEARAAALEMFADFDQNGDGSVTRAEAAAGAVLWRERRFEGRFLALDVDRDGVLTEEETEIGPRRFAQLDRNADQRLTRSELKRAFSAARGRSAGSAGRATALSAGFGRWDLNRDGHVTREEAVQVADRRFIRKDRNGDGVLTRPEPPLPGA
jgi:Ca2+-binding EF-hand superfamily protein